MAALSLAIVTPSSTVLIFDVLLDLSWKNLAKYKFCLSFNKENLAMKVTWAPAVRKAKSCHRKFVTRTHVQNILTKKTCDVNICHIENLLVYNQF